MKWEKGARGGQVEDRRGSKAGVAVGGGGVAILIVAVIAYFMGADPRDIARLTEQLSQAQAPAEAVAPGTPEDRDGRFIDTMVTSNDQVWSKLLEGGSSPYRRARTVLYSDATQTACGTGQAAMGPFYCPADETIYLDTDFFAVMEQQLKAPGDFARAYVIAHEYGHHIQTVLGTSANLHEAKRGLSKAEANQISVRQELEADCYAGVWAKQANAAYNWIEPGDIEAAINAASAVGDDTLQKKSQGQVVPDSFTHGSSAQRVRWFRRGFDEGYPDVCDTYSAAEL